MVAEVYNTSNILEVLSKEYKKAIIADSKLNNKGEDSKKCWLKDFVEWNAAEGLDQEKLTNNIKNFSALIISLLKENDSKIRAERTRPMGLGDLDKYGETVFYTAKDIELLFKMLGVL